MEPNMLMVTVLLAGSIALNLAQLALMIVLLRWSAPRSRKIRAAHAAAQPARFVRREAAAREAARRPRTNHESRVSQARMSQGRTSWDDETRDDAGQ